MQKWMAKSAAYSHGAAKKKKKKSWQCLLCSSLDVCGKGFCPPQTIQPGWDSILLAARFRQPSFLQLKREVHHIYKCIYKYKSGRFLSSPRDKRKTWRKRSA